MPPELGSAFPVAFRAVRHWTEITLITLFGGGCALDVLVGVNDGGCSCRSSMSSRANFFLDLLGWEGNEAGS